MRRIRSAWDEEEMLSDETGIYSEDVRDLLVDDDEISSIEAAFMRGWEEAM